MRRTLALFLVLPLAAWDANGHRMVADGAIRTLPPELRGWLAGREAAFRDAAVEPDLWKREDPKEPSRHYLYVEAYGGTAAVPADADAALRQVGAIIFTQAGQLPWVIGDRYRRLVTAFRQRDAEAVVKEAGWLCHYVADAHVPLHTTWNHDGKKTGQKGVHSRWEKKLVAWKVPGLPDPGPAIPPADPAHAPLAWIAQAHGAVPEVLAADREALGDLEKPGPPAETPYWTALWKRQGELLLRQLRGSALDTGGLVLAAWREAGSPAAARRAPGITIPQEPRAEVRTASAGIRAQDAPGSLPRPRQGVGNQVEPGAVDVGTGPAKTFRWTLFPPTPPHASATLRRADHQETP